MKLTFRQSVFSFLRQTGQFHAVQYYVRLIPFCYEPPIDRILILGNSVCVIFFPPHKMVTGILVYHRPNNNYRMVQRYDTSKTHMRFKEIHIILLCGSVIQKTLVIRVA